MKARPRIPSPRSARAVCRQICGTLVLLALSAALAAPAGATTVSIPATKDNTLYESATGSLSNAAGEYVFTGRTKNGLIRRAVIHFDVAGTVPAGSTINSVTLQLVVSRVANNTLRMTSVHRLNADWGEGTSNATQNEGEGASATTGDATWIHRFYPATSWSSPGGDFDPNAHATTPVTGNGTYQWTGAALVADVQSWLDAPLGNFGWMVRGDEGV